MKIKKINIPVFKSQSEEADWWASQAGRSFVKQKSIEAVSKGETLRGSPLVQRLNKTASVQIALRLSESRKGIGYQTLLKMLLHEGLQREARRL